MLHTNTSQPVVSGMHPIWVTVAQAKALTNIGHTKLYELIGNGAIKTTKVGSRTLVSYASLETLGHSEAA